MRIHQHDKKLYLNFITSFLLNSYEFVKGIFVYYKMEEKIIFPLSKSGWKLLIGLWKHLGCPYSRYKPMIFGDYVRVRDNFKNRKPKGEVKKIVLEQMKRTLEELHSFGIYETKFDESGKKFVIITKPGESADPLNQFYTMGWKVKVTHRRYLSE